MSFHNMERRRSSQETTYGKKNKVNNKATSILKSRLPSKDQTNCREKENESKR